MDTDDWDCVSRSCKDLIERMLVVDSNERISIDEILQHPWMVSNGSCDANDNDNSNTAQGTTSPSDSENRNERNSNENVDPSQINEDSN